MYSREEVKAITDKGPEHGKADAVEVDFSGGERSATRFANSNITANMVEHDQKPERHGVRRAEELGVGVRRTSSTTRRCRRRSRRRRSWRSEARENPELMPLVKPPQDYVPVDAALPAAVNFGPAERAAMVKQSIDICEKKGVVGSGYIPKIAPDDVHGQLRRGCSPTTTTPRRASS